MNSADQKVHDDVARYGWTVMKVGDADPLFAYSVGLHRTFGHPEIIMFGLDAETLHQLINDIGEEVRTGHRFTDGETSDLVLQDYDCIFRTVATERYPEYLGWARWFYGGDDFPVLECIWPDRQGRFPWEKDVVPEIRERQPLLYSGA